MTGASVRIIPSSACVELSEHGGATGDVGAALPIPL